MMEYPATRYRFSVQEKRIEYLAHSARQIDQIERRVLKGEKISYNEKVFSIFEPHTEWISKGKAGVLAELGLKVCIVKDQYGLILNYQVMENQTDEKIAVPLLETTAKAFPNVVSCSFDKGFHSKLKFPIFLSTGNRQALIITVSNQLEVSKKLVKTTTYKKSTIR
jgi:hypothetical protein